MAVRVRIRIETAARGGEAARSVETAAVVNSGFEVEAPEVILPPRAAEALGLWPVAPPSAEAARYATPAGEAAVLRLPDACEVSLLVGRRAVRSCRATAVVFSAEQEVLLSDALGEVLGIEITRLQRGTWRLTGEKREHPSEPRQTW